MVSMVTPITSATRLPERLAQDMTQCRADDIFHRIRRQDGHINFPQGF
jgi:hypothetical protein